MLNEVLSRDFGAHLSFCNDAQGYGALKQSPAFTAQAQFRVVEAIQAVANYWKHSDEWPTCSIKSRKRLRGGWDVSAMRSKHHKRTAEIVVALGMEYGCTGNMRRAAQALGVTDFARLSAIRGALTSWATGVYDLSEKEVERRARTRVKSVRKSILGEPEKGG
jgi:hypothetical protein